MQLFYQDVDLYKDYYKLLHHEKASAAILNMISSAVQHWNNRSFRYWESCAEHGLARCGGLHGLNAQTTLMRFKKNSVSVTTKTKQNIFAHTTVFALFLLHTNAFSFGNTCILFDGFSPIVHAKKVRR